MILTYSSLPSSIVLFIDVKLPIFILRSFELEGSDGCPRV